MIDIEEAGTQEDMLRHAQMRGIIERRDSELAAHTLVVLNSISTGIEKMMSIIEESTDQRTIMPSDDSAPVTTYALSPKLAQRLIAEQAALINLLVGHAEGFALHAGISRDDRQYQLLELLMHRFGLHAWFVSLS